jgi:hypothetical protein
MHDIPQPENRALVVGHLVPQIQHGSSRIVTENYTSVGGRTRKFVLRIAAPFSGTCALPILLDDQASGVELLMEAAADTRITVAGRLEWSPPSVALLSTPQTYSEIRVRALQVRAATDAELTGADVWIEGEVQRTLQFAPHAHRRSLMLALTTIEIKNPLNRPGSRAVLHNSHFIPVVIPLSHADTPKLLRKGNRVRVEGLIERFASRVPVAVTDTETQHAASAAADLSRDNAPDGTTEASGAPSRSPAPGQQMQRVIRTRVIAGFVELLAGREVSVDEAREKMAAKSEAQAEAAAAQQ